MTTLPHSLFALSCVYWGLLEAWVWFRERGSVKQTQDRNSRILLVAFIGGGIYAATLITSRTSFVLPGTVGLHLLIGAILIVFGTTFRLWSILTLGRFFRTTVMIQQHHEVITSGPYRYLRHPSYTGILVNALGIGIGLGNWLALVTVMVLVFVGLYQRIRVEEQVLSTALGQEYQTYMTRTKRLLPFIF
jgi:protein-S-isoprenylcysteine O-methyltransferase Ste14